MSEKEAQEILSAAADAKRKDIYAAYQRLMLKVHPHTGESNHFTRQLNKIKASLLE
jgi:DnaJ-class molecular chaperone